MAPRDERPPSSAPRTPNVLVIEDDVDLCRMLADGLAAAGFDVHVACTAVAGLAEAREREPDVVLLDLTLPDLDGLSLLARLQGAERTASIPVVVVSDRADDATRSAALAAGARAFVAKPLDMGALLATLRPHLAARRADRPGPGWERAIAQGVSRLVHADLDAERVCRAVLDGAMEILSLAAATLWLVEGEWLVLRLQSAMYEPYVRAHPRIRLGEGLIGLVARDHRPLTVADVSTDLRVLNRAVFAGLGLRGFIAVPLLHDDRLLGVLSGARTTPGHFGDEDVQMLAALAEHAATVLAQVRLLGESERRRATAEALAALAAEVSAAHEPETVLDRVVAYVKQLVEAEIAYLEVLKPPEGQATILKLVGARGTRMARIAPAEGQGIDGWVMRHDRPFRTDDYLTEPRITHDFDDVVREEGVTAWAAVPLRARGRLVGVLGAVRRGPRPFTADDERMLVQLAAQTAVALDNAWLYREATRARAQWEATVDHLHEGLALVDGNRRILRINRTLASWVGRHPAELTGRVLDEVLDAYAGEEAHARLAEAQSGDGPRLATVEVPSLGRTLEETLAPVAQAAAGVQGLAVMLRDVTEARRMQEQLLRSEKLASLGEMLAGVAHELNNPLTGVLGFAQLLEAQVTDPAHREDLRKLAQEAMRAARIVQQLLRFARQHAPERRATDLNQLAAAAALAVEVEARAAGITVETDLTPDLPVSFLDPHQVQQAVVALVTNARQAMTAAGRTGRIRIATRQVAGSLELEVSDEGPGIPPNILPRIFDPFFTTKGPREGTGLGLSLCHSIVAAHGGEIWADGTPGAGATFHVRLPIMLPPGSADAAPRRPLARAAVPLRVLVADDEPAVRDLACDALAARGHQVEAVADGEAALRRLSEAPFDVLLVDIRMPGLDGRAAVERLRRPDGAGAPRRIVVMTGDSIRAETRRWIEATRLPVLDKPFTLDALAAAVEG
ncbi:MAG TPA: response regulator [Thermodesulfobacteriota bacterium]